MFDRIPSGNFHMLRLVAEVVRCQAAIEKGPVQWADNVMIDNCITHTYIHIMIVIVMIMIIPMIIHADPEACPNLEQATYQEIPQAVEQEIGISVQLCCWGVNQNVLILRIL